MVNTQLKSYLKRKGTGPTMSEPLSEAQLDEVLGLLMDPSGNATTQATLLTAIRMLTQSPAESAWYLRLSSEYQRLPTRLWFLFEPPATPFLRLVHLVFAHQDLSDTDAKAAFDWLFSPDIPDPQKAAFLEAERLKRETLVENQACYRACWERTTHVSADMPFLIDFAASYDGLNRSLHLSVFVATVLAAMGYPVILHGVNEIGPKNGQTAYKILAESGKAPIRDVSQILADLTHPNIRWAYIDQSQFSSDLFSLKPLRVNMLKRPLLATVEKLVSPVRAHQNFLITSYTHPPYRAMMSRLLSECGFFDRVVLVRGVEGGIQFPIDRRAPVVNMGNGHIVDTFTEAPAEHGTQRTLPDYTLSAAQSVRVGVGALRGEIGPAYHGILHTAAATLSNLGFVSYPDAVMQAKDVVRSGLALRHWQNGMEHA